MVLVSGLLSDLAQFLGEVDRVVLVAMALRASAFDDLVAHLAEMLGILDMLEVFELLFPSHHDLFLD